MVRRTSASLSSTGPSMCGFAGILNGSGMKGAELAQHASHMIAPIAHRGPDDEGIWSDEGAGVALGFRRLAIIDLSPEGHQPMWSTSRRFVLVFNGEVYNFSDLRHELGQHGHRFRGHSDTEVILAAFEQWGIREAVCRFVGMFAIAVWDTNRRELSLVRDRLGKKPLYVYREPGLITFGSELKALLAGPSFDREIDPNALASYLRYLYVPAPQSIFRRVIKIPAAHILTLRDPNCPLPEAEAYWSLRDVARAGLSNPFPGGEHEAVDQLEALLSGAGCTRTSRSGRCSREGSTRQRSFPSCRRRAAGPSRRTRLALPRKSSTRPVMRHGSRSISVRTIRS
jgi:asparagine synthase (glutamine-hydrolysing)